MIYIAQTGNRKDRETTMEARNAPGYGQYSNKLCLIVHSYTTVSLAAENEETVFSMAQYMLLTCPLSHLNLLSASLPAA